MGRVVLGEILKEKELQGVDWIYVAEDRDKWRVFVT
jgi:hypothetical protein